VKEREDMFSEEEKMEKSYDDDDPIEVTLR